MPLAHLRGLAGPQRTAEANRQLGTALAFVAGAINAGGFLAVHQYTSHMSGIVSAMADHLVLGLMDLVLAGAGGLLSFLLGAMCATVMVNYARRHRLHTEYAGPLLLEAALLLGFGMLGAQLEALRAGLVPVTVMLLTFIMGLQNAVVSKLSRSEIRTTHVTGIVTDIGIELGRMVYWNRRDRSLAQAEVPAAPPPVRADPAKLRLLLGLFIAFFCGGVAGALGFSRLGYVATVPLALCLVALTLLPALDDWREAFRRWRG